MSHFLGIPVFHNQANVKLVSVTKKFFWLGEYCVLTCGNIKNVPKLGKIKFMKYISANVLQLFNTNLMVLFFIPLGHFLPNCKISKKKKDFGGVILQKHYVF